MTIRGLSVARHLLVLAALVAGSATLTSCGTLSEREPSSAPQAVHRPSPHRLLKLTGQRVKRADSVSILLSRPHPGGPQEFRMRGSLRRTATAGSLIFAGGAEYRVVGSQVWITGGGDLVDRLTGHYRPGDDSWAVVPPGPADYLRRATVDALMGDLVRHWSSIHAVKGAAVREIWYADAPAFRLMVLDDDNKPFPAVVAADGTWELLQFGQPGKDMMTFEDWNAVPRVKPPKPSKIQG